MSLALQNQIIHGDFVDVVKTIKDESIDFILTDIPYEISRENNFKTMKDRTGRTGIDFGEWDYNFDISTLQVLIPKLKKGASLIICHSFEQYDVIRKNLSELLLKDRIIFRKTNPMPRNRDRRYIANIELLSWYVKDGNTWTFNRQKEPYEDSVISFPAESGGGFIKYHPTQKPVKLFEYLIKIHTKPNDLVLDPCAGSGTTGVACQNNDRNYICIEKDEKYFNIMQKRLTNQSQTLTIFTQQKQDSGVE
jgi:DNA modification methylase